MPFFKKSIFTTECDRCGVKFHIGEGGVCERCKKILCEPHLHGSLVRRVRVAFGAPVICVKCRAQAERAAAAGAASST